MRKEQKRRSIIISILLITFSVIFFILPFLLVISVSFTKETALQTGGFNLIPVEFSLEGYEYVFAKPDQIIDAYIVTAAQAILGTFLSVLIMALCAYPLSRTSFKPRRVIMFYILFTMLFSGGMIPGYILNTQYLNLKNNFLIYILPGLVGAWNVIIIRTFFTQLPHSLIESAKLDGASELQIFFKIILPLSKPVIATISFLVLLAKWNDWMTSMLYITDPSLQTLQYLLQSILNQLDYIVKMASEIASGMNIEFDTSELPGENMRFAMSIVAAGPMMFIFPAFQKYFVKGLVVGSVKG